MGWKGDVHVLSTIDGKTRLDIICEKIHSVGAKIASRAKMRNNNDDNNKNNNKNRLVKSGFLLIYVIIYYIFITFRPALIFSRLEEKLWQ